MYKICTESEYLYYLTKKQMEASKAKEDFETIMQDRNINALLYKLFKEAKINKITDANISAIQEDETFFGYKDKIGLFEDLFSRSECLKLDIFTGDDTVNRDLIFLIGDDLLLIIKEKTGTFLKEGDITLSAKVVTISSFVADNNLREILSDVEGTNERWYENRLALAFIDENKSVVSEVYYATDDSLEYQGNDIREILKKISLDDIVTRATEKINYKQLEIMDFNRTRNANIPKA